MKIGIDSYCYHRLFGEVYDDQEKPEELKTVDAFLEKAHQLGVDGVSLETCFLPSLESSYLKELGARIDAYGFDRVFAWGHPNGLERGKSQEAFAEMKMLIPRARDIGTDVMRITASAFDWRYENHDQQIKAIVPMLKEAVKIAEDNGVKLAIENHIDFRAEEILRILEEVGSKNLGVNFDTGNFLRLMDDPVAGMEMLAPYVLSTHIKDLQMNPLAKATDWFFFSGVPVGFGLIDNDKLAELLHKAGYQGFLAVEIDHPMPEWNGLEEEAVEISVKNLRKIGNKYV